MNDYEAKQEARRQRYEELAEKHRQEQQARWKASDQMASVMNGQPILIGHHSEKRHRNDIKRMHNHMSKGVEHGKTAEYYDRKAAGVGKGGISSDDPDAIEKLRDKLASMEANQEYMKKCNKAIRLKDTEKGDAIMLEMGLRPDQFHELREPDFCGRVGFPSYSLQNNNGNMRRVRQRIEQLENAPTETVRRMYGDIEVVANTEENRYQIIFPGKPSAEVRKVLKSHGFRWSRYNMAWQRHLNNAGRYAVDCVMKKITDEDN